MDQMLDAAYPQTSQQFIAAMRATGAVAFAWYLGGDDALHAWDIQVVRDVEAAGFRGVAVYVPFLDHAGDVDGADAVRLAQAATLAAGYVVSLDLEPGVFASHPIAVDQAYADAFNEQLHSAGFATMTYGTPATVAACANRSDYIWVAVPGQPDPTQIGLEPLFFWGKRIVQWGNGSYGGVAYDVSNSEFPLRVAGGGGSGRTGVKDMPTFIRDPATGAIFWIGESGKRHVDAKEWQLYVDAGTGYSAADDITGALVTIPDVSTGGGTEPVEPTEPQTITGTITLTGPITAQIT